MLNADDIADIKTLRGIVTPTNRASWESLKRDYAWDTVLVELEILAMDERRLVDPAMVRGALDHQNVERLVRESGGDEAPSDAMPPLQRAPVVPEHHPTPPPATPDPESAMPVSPSISPLLLKLKQRKEAESLHYTQIGKAIGVSGTMVSHYLIGRNIPRQSILDNIAGWLGEAPSKSEATPARKESKPRKLRTAITPSSSSPAAAPNLAETASAGHDSAFVADLSAAVAKQRSSPYNCSAMPLGALADLAVSHAAHLDHIGAAGLSAIIRELAQRVRAVAVVFGKADVA